MSKKSSISRQDIVDLLSEKQRKASDSWSIKDGRLQKTSLKKAWSQKKVSPESELDNKLTKSYIHGSPNHTNLYTTFPELLEKRSRDTPDEEAHVFWRVKDQSRLQREAISFSVLSERSAILAGNLLDMGLEPGDRIAIIGENCPDWIYVEYAALRIGICLIRLHSGLVTTEGIRHVVFNQKCRALIVSPGPNEVTLKKVTKVIPGVKSVDELLKKLPNMRLITMGDSSRSKVKSVQDLIGRTKKMEDVIQVQDGLDPHGLAIAYSTSGSSGFPKFVGITHFSYINNLLAMDDMKWEGSKAKFFNDRPFTWIGSGMHAAVVLGVSIIHMDPEVTQRSENATMVLSVMEEERVNVAMAMTNVIENVRKDESKELKFPDTLQCIISGGERLPQHTLDFCRENFEATCLLYATSETCVVSKRVMSMYIANEHPYRLKPLPHVEMKVTDEDEKIVPVGTPGKLFVRSPYLFQSYLNFDDYQKGKQIFHVAGGRGQGLWYDTEDLGVVFDDGSIQVIGREKDLIHRDDVTIYPFTYEQVLRGYPHVRDVYVYGVEDDELGEEVGVCVAFEDGYTDTKESLHHYIEEADLFPLPEYYLVVTDFPRLPNGKIDRKALDAMIEDKIDDSDDESQEEANDDSDDNKK